MIDLDYIHLFFANMNFMSKKGVPEELLMKLLAFFVGVVFLRHRWTLMSVSENA